MREVGRKRGIANKGKLHPHTLDARRIYAEYRQGILEKAQQLLRRHMIPAMGCTYVYKKVGENRVLVEDPLEIEEALNVIDDAEGYDESERSEAHYYYIVTKDPDWRAIESLMNRVFGKAVARLEYERVGGFGALENLSNEELLDITEGRVDCQRAE